MLPVYVFDDRVVDLSGVPGWQGNKEAARSRVLKIGRCGANRTKCVLLPCLFYSRVELALTKAALDRSGS